MNYYRKLLQVTNELAILKKKQDNLLTEMADHIDKHTPNIQLCAGYALVNVPGDEPYKIPFTHMNFIFEFAKIFVGGGVHPTTILEDIEAMEELEEDEEDDPEEEEVVFGFNHLQGPVKRLLLDLIKKPMLAETWVEHLDAVDADLLQDICEWASISPRKKSYTALECISFLQECAKKEEGTTNAS